MLFARAYRHEAWKKLSGNWTTAVVSYLIVSVLMSVASYVLVGSLLFGGVLSIGMNIVLLGISRNGSSNFENLFDGFRNGLGNNIVASILVQVFTFLWSLLFVIPGIIATYRYAMTPFIMAEHPEMTASEAIWASKQMMIGHKWELFCLDFSFFGWNLLCGLTMNLGNLFLNPYTNAAHAAFYRNISARDPYHEL
jgi:uncharacterized membrane protein